MSWHSGYQAPNRNKLRTTMSNALGTFHTTLKCTSLIGNKGSPFNYNLVFGVPQSPRIFTGMIYISTSHLTICIELFAPRVSLNGPVRSNLTSSIWTFNGSICHPCCAVTGRHAVPPTMATSG